ncbi:MAG: aminoglycoside 6-adenylyltransferase, partial [Bacteroidota bacterium]
PCPIPAFVVDTWVADRFSSLGQTIQTRLLILEQDRKIDFSFYPLSFVQHLQQPGPLPPDFDHGYQILLDKDDRADTLIPPSFQAFQSVRPSTEQWEECQREFRFECWHVRKYLARGEWYHALWRLGEARQFLLQLLLWETASRNAQTINAKPLGKNLSQILSVDHQLALRASFSNADQEAIHCSLEQIEAIFSKLNLN